MKSIALDSNIVIDILNSKSSTISIIERYHLICLPIVVCGELLYGAHNSQKHVMNLQVVHAFINKCTLLETNFLVAEQYAKIRLQLKKIGKPIPENDIWIAALCIVKDIPLLSFDKHFIDITSLKLIHK
jgi:tRNA(fMet)-specific endonuclease VapC